MKESGIIIVKMIQKSTYKWELTSYMGHVIKTDILVNSERDALNYAHKYISSFNNWHIEMVPLIELKDPSSVDKTKEYNKTVSKLGSSNDRL